MTLVQLLRIEVIVHDLICIYISLVVLLRMEVIIVNLKINTNLYRFVVTLSSSHQSIDLEI